MNLFNIEYAHQIFDLKNDLKFYQLSFENQISELLFTFDFYFDLYVNFDRSN